VTAGARVTRAAKTVGLSSRTLARWRLNGNTEDRRKGPKTAPSHRLSSSERQQVVETLTSPEYRDLPPGQVVPRLADEGIYLASESTMYRILREAKLLKHRSAARPSTKHPPRSHCATAPNSVWSWDITYLPTTVRGRFFYLYMCIDIFSRKVVGWTVEASEDVAYAEPMLCAAFKHEPVDLAKLVLHSDNGTPMKASTLLATLRGLGVMPSFSRPQVSDDNPFSESLFRTMKYRPAYPRKPFQTIEEARAWVSEFVAWYNHEHLHSGIRFLAPAARHARRDAALLEARRAVYAAARALTPRRWTQSLRNWAPVGAVFLNQGRVEPQASSSLPEKQRRQQP
jgi:putative transposase